MMFLIAILLVNFVQKTRYQFLGNSVKKFYDFFEVVIIKGEILGKVDQFFWKKEYQMRGAPYYHVLLWINKAPMIGVDSEITVLKWIQEQITCRIPDESNQELHRLVTKYQMQKCS